MSSAEKDPRREGTIWMLNLDGSVPVVEPLVNAMFRGLGPEALPNLQTVIGQDMYEEWLQRLKGGRRCYSAWVEGQLVSYGWVSFEEEHIGELNLRIKLLPGEVYIWDCATMPAFRQKRLYSAILSYIIRELHTKGLCRAWIGADRENLPSQQGIARAGFHHVADLVIERILAIRQVWVQGLPGIPDQVVAEARRAFLNDRDKVWNGAAASGM